MFDGLESYLDKQREARIAGLWYLLLGITAGLAWMFSSKIFDRSSSEATAANIISMEHQFIMAIIATIIGQISFFFLAKCLYKILSPVNKTQALLMFFTVLISIPIMFINIVFQTVALAVLRHVELLSSFSPEQINSIAALFIYMSVAGTHIAGLFWGLWLFPLAYLMWKSGYFPKTLAVLVLFSGISYLFGNFSFIINQSFFNSVEKWISIPQALGEIAMVFWLLIKGIITPIKEY